MTIAYVETDWILLNLELSGCFEHRGQGKSFVMRESLTIRVGIGRRFFGLFKHHRQRPPDNYEVRANASGEDVLNFAIAFRFSQNQWTAYNNHAPNNGAAMIKVATELVAFFICYVLFSMND